jgi:hypothetical protein
MFTEVRPGKWFIPNCVDTRRFDRSAPAKELDGKNAILVPRNIYRQRGIHLAVDAFAKLVAGGDRKSTLVIVGKVVDANYYDGLLQQIEAHGLAGRVEFVGHVSWQEMPAWYSGAVCTLIPTVDWEGTSLSALESMACGTPVIATRVGGLKDLPCAHADTDAESLARELARVLASAKQLSEGQREAVRTVFNLENWAAAWSRVIEALPR